MNNLLIKRLLKRKKLSKIAKKTRLFVCNLILSGYICDALFTKT